MEEKQTLLTRNDFFNDYVVGEKLSTHHDGEREVYEATDSKGKKVVLTVFNVKSRRYAVNGCARRRQPDFIDEVRYLKNLSGCGAVSDVIDSGMTSVKRRRLGWIVQKFIEGESLEELIGNRKIEPSEAVTVIASLEETINEIHQLTRGGGHFNICPSNIIVSFDEGELERVCLVGFSNIGSATGGTVGFDTTLIDRRFTAPETSMGVFNHRTDIYSLGMVMLTIIAGFPETEVSGIGRVPVCPLYRHGSCHDGRTRFRRSEIHGGHDAEGARDPRLPRRQQAGM